jgi:hypothetical protein
LAIGRASSSCRLTRRVAPVRGDPGQPPAGLGGDPPGRGQQLGQVVDRATQPAPAPSRGRVGGAGRGGLGGFLVGAAQRPAGVGQQLLGVGGGALGQPGQFAGDPPDRVLGLVPARRGA